MTTCLPHRSMKWQSWSFIIFFWGRSSQMSFANLRPHFDLSTFVDKNPPKAEGKTAWLSFWTCHICFNLWLYIDDIWPKWHKLHHNFSLTFVGRPSVFWCLSSMETEWSNQLLHRCLWDSFWFDGCQTLPKEAGPRHLEATQRWLKGISNCKQANLAVFLSNNHLWRKPGFLKVISKCSRFPNQSTHWVDLPTTSNLPTKSDVKKTRHVFRLARHLS